VGGDAETTALNFQFGTDSVLMRRSDYMETEAVTASQCVETQAVTVLFTRCPSLKRRVTCLRACYTQVREGLKT